MATQLGIDQLDVELDVKVIVELLNGVECPNRSYSPLLNDCKSLMASLVQVRVRHCFREVNQCADFLAKGGCNMVDNFVVFDSPPPADLYFLLDSDKNGLYYYKHVASTLVSVDNL